MRLLFTFLGIVAFAGIAWVATLPDKAACVASGRVVDPTERHCESADGYVQLREHAIFHSREVVLGAAALIGIGYAVHRLRRRPPPGADAVR